MTDKPLDVKAAYALRTPADSKALYADWARTYDDSFAAALEYVFPDHVARVFEARGGSGPVLDAGAGTGLVAQALQRRADVVCDAFDISEEMLEVARAKGVYRALIQGDLTARLPFDSGTYAGVVSAGTFTHGHVGPEALDELLRVAAPGALFVLTIKQDLYDTRGFAEKFASFGERINQFEIEEIPIYGPGVNSAHARDRGLIASFRRP
ncbi:class I SAM-dependent DNA methyltransferase [Roseobacter weihaiensis]|uniref:class I SAM-dependent DNA methyltransferase n=1 Tax=Roseobacter weihaiensis TaxID=2763262 RepID=UPI001D0A7C17|nr:class I SAM-dependent methyltransferase [Roseobacter sp. H9]